MGCAHGGRARGQLVRGALRREKPTLLRGISHGRNAADILRSGRPLTVERRRSRDRTPPNGPAFSPAGRRRMEAGPLYRRDCRGRGAGRIRRTDSPVSALPPPTGDSALCPLGLHFEGVYRALALRYADARSLLMPSPARATPGLCDIPPRPRRGPAAHPVPAVWQRCRRPCVRGR